MIRAFLALATIAAVAASAAAAAVGVRWTVLVTGKAEQTGYQPVGYVAVTKAQEQRFAGRLGSNDRALLGKVNLVNTGVIAVFLGGVPCSTDLKVNGVSRTATSVTVSLRYSLPRPGVAMCVRVGTPYILIGASRKTLGHPAPTHVKVVAVARA